METTTIHVRTAVKIMGDGLECIKFYLNFKSKEITCPSPSATRTLRFESIVDSSSQVLGSIRLEINKATATCHLKNETSAGTRVEECFEGKKEDGKQAI